ncbi:MAG TPA: hypothetical protein VGL55_05020 [Steroidobacteraceae bacterium]|jgi:hypothetical protein
MHSILLAAAAMVLAAAAPGRLFAAEPPPGHAPSGQAPSGKSAHGCLANGGGYLRAQIRGALVLDVDLHNSELECEGGPRPDGSGLRISFAGPLRSDGRRLRVVFGVSKASEGQPGRALPTNLTLIFEGESRLFATRGEDKCTVDQLTQERLGALGGPRRSYRVIARGFCIAPVSSVSQQESILVSRFDFAGLVTFEDAETGVTK